MDNHLRRPEVQEALGSGQGSGLRFNSRRFYSRNNRTSPTTATTAPTRAPTICLKPNPA
jgi:hypothetical protein